MLKVTVTVDANALKVSLANKKAKAQEAATEAIAEGAGEIRDYLVNELMNGVILQHRSGQLARGLYIRRYKDNVRIFFRGTHSRGDDDEWAIPNAILAGILENGLYYPEKTYEKKPGWDQPNTRWGHHWGISGHHFMQKALEDKRERVRKLVLFYVQRALNQR